MDKSLVVLPHHLTAIRYFFIDIGFHGEITINAKLFAGVQHQIIMLYSFRVIVAVKKAVALVLLLGNKN
jgi:hypothetical protein